MSKLSLESVVQVTGTVVKRPPGQESRVCHFYEIICSV